MAEPELAKEGGTMAVLERKKMGDKMRAAYAQTILAYQETARQLGQDPLNLRKLNPVGGVVTGKELSDKLERKVGDKDSLWWVTLNPNTGAFSHYVEIAKDRSKFQRALNKQLKDWDTVSAVKQLANKRRKNGAIIAAVTTAVVIATLVTAGAAAGPGAGGLAGLGTALQATGAAFTAAAPTLGTVATTIMSVLPPKQAAEIETQAVAMSSTPPLEETPLSTYAVAGAVGLFAVFSLAYAAGIAWPRPR